MSANEFDELVRQKFDSSDIAYNPGNWDKMSQQLDKATQTQKNSFLTIIATWPAITGIAATIALLVALPLFWLNGDKNAANNTVVAEKATPAVSLPATDVASAKPVQAEPSRVEEQKSGLPIALGNRKNKRTAVVAPGAAITPHNVINSTTDAVAANNATDENKSKVKPAIAAQQKEKQRYVIPEQEPVKNTATRTNINLIGGFNYNENSTGFMVGASANRNLNNKLYIEGNLAYVNSNVGGSAFEKTHYADQFDAAGGPGLNSSEVKSAPEQQPVQYKLSYLQFSPVMGYHITDRFTVSAGPDLQQLLNTETYFIEDLPRLDMGVLGKAEFGITKKLKAGVQYRAGVNNVVQSTKHYTERNYMQVQLRYSIFNK